MDEDGDADGFESGSMTGSETLEMNDVASNGGLEDDEETGLTSTVRNERTRRKRRHTRFDERVLPRPDVRQKREDRMADKAVMSNVATNALFIGLWYTFSISISVVSYIVRYVVRGWANRMTV